MKQGMIKPLAFVAACVLLFSGFAVRSVLGCGGCYPPCSGCCTCQGGECKPNQTKCGGCCKCSGCSCVDDDSKCSQANCYDCNDCSCVYECDSDCEVCDGEGSCQAIDINSVSSDKEVACVGCDITFTVVTDPSGHESKVQWSGGGDPATGSGATFVTDWASHGTKTVTATICENDKSKQVTVAAPTNFRQDGDPCDLGAGVL